MPNIRSNDINICSTFNSLPAGTLSLTSKIILRCCVCQSKIIEALSRWERVNFDGYVMLGSFMFKSFTALYPPRHTSLSKVD